MIGKVQQDDHVRTKENLHLQAQVHYGHEKKPGAAGYLKEAGSSCLVEEVTL